MKTIQDNERFSLANKNRVKAINDHMDLFHQRDRQLKIGLIQAHAFRILEKATAYANEKEKQQNGCSAYE